MSKQGISTGSSPNSGTGDTLLQGAIKINSNFNEIYSKLGDGTDLLAGNPNLTVGIVTATKYYGDGSSLTGVSPSGNVGSGVTVQNNGTGIGTATVINFGDYLTVSPISSGICTITSVFVGSNQLGVRTDVSQSTGSIASGASANITFSGFKAYTLYKVQTSHAAWVTIYTDTSSRSSDSSRSQTTDPTPGSGVILDVITTGAQTQLITPATIGFNNDTPASTSIYARVKNNSGSTQNITVTLTILQLET